MITAGLCTASAILHERIHVRRLSSSKSDLRCATLLLPSLCRRLTLATRATGRAASCPGKSRLAHYLRVRSRALRLLCRLSFAGMLWSLPHALEMISSREALLAGPSPCCPSSSLRGSGAGARRLVAAREHINTGMGRQSMTPPGARRPTTSAPSVTRNIVNESPFVVRSVNRCCSVRSS